MRTIRATFWIAAAVLAPLFAGCSADATEAPRWQFPPGSADGDPGVRDTGSRGDTDVDAGGITTGDDRIAAGFRHTCAVVSGGKLRCWGSGARGQLADGEAGAGRYNPRPAPVVGLDSAAGVAAGRYHTCFRRPNGTVRCSGWGKYGQLGAGTKSNTSAPVAVDGIDSAVDLSAGRAHTCAVLENGSVHCWGAVPGGSGSGGSSTPSKIDSLFTAVEVASGSGFFCARLRDGDIRCRGGNRWGQLGDGSTESSSRPVGVVGISTATALSAGRDHACAVLESGKVRCWGSGTSGELGNGRSGPKYKSTRPQPAADLEAAVEVRAGDAHSCALLESGGVRCWGAGQHGQLGTGRDGDGYEETMPVAVRGLDSARQVAVGRFYTCALLRRGGVRCFGTGRRGALGNGKSGRDYSESRPVAVRFGD